MSRDRMTGEINKVKSIEKNILVANIRKNTSLLQSLSINNSQTS